MSLYISSYDYNEFFEAIEIYEYAKTMMDGKSVLVAKISKSLIGQKYGLGGHDIDTLYLVNRVDEKAFDKLSQYPIDVHVLILKDALRQNPSSLSELQNIAWASLYDKKEDARNHKII